MFEYLIYKSKAGTNSRISIKRPVIENSNHVKSYRQIGPFHLEILTMKPDHEFQYEDERVSLFVMGSIYTKPDNTNKTRKQLFPVDIVNLSESELTGLRGHFHIVRIDKIKGIITVFNDLFGLKPLYYGESGTHIFIGNSLSVLKAFSPEIDKAGLIEKLIFEHNLLDNTIYQDIFTLNEATILNWNGSFETKPYFSWFEYLRDTQGKCAFSIQKYITAFDSIVYSSASKTEKNLVTLTGGHDGRVVLSSFLKQGLPVETFSFGRPGSENTVIPEKAAEEIGFKHHSVYLLKEFEKNYLNNARLTTWLSDGELVFSQQTTLYALQHLPASFNKVYTGLLAGELAGPVHLIKDYINPVYYTYIYKEEPFSLDRELLKLKDILEIKDTSGIEQVIKKRIEQRKRLIHSISKSPNKHLFSLGDMITWGFRKFYGYQMHLARYHLENFPVFCDFDLMEMLINSNYNLIYRNSYKSLFRRRHSRKLQLAIITLNSGELSDLSLDRGYTPNEAVNSLYTIHKLLKYFRRKRKIKKGNYTPDFMGEKWTNLIRHSEILHSGNLNGFFNYDMINQKYNDQNCNLIWKDICIISNLLFLDNK